MFKKAYKTCVILMVLKVRCDQMSKMLIFRYTCDKSERVEIVTAAAGFNDSDLGRCYISPLEPLCRASMFGKNPDDLVTTKLAFLVHVIPILENVLLVFIFSRRPFTKP